MGTWRPNFHFCLFLRHLWLLAVHRKFQKRLHYAPLFLPRLLQTLAAPALVVDLMASKKLVVDLMASRKPKWDGVLVAKRCDRLPTTKDFWRKLCFTEFCLLSTLNISSCISKLSFHARHTSNEAGRHNCAMHQELSKQHALSPPPLTRHPCGRHTLELTCAMEAQFATTSSETYSQLQEAATISDVQQIKRMHNMPNLPIPFK